MTIKKFQGRTEGEAVARAKAELGENAVIMNVKEVKPKGIFQSFKKSSFEVTAATEEKEKHVDSGMALKNLQKMHETINVAADEPIQIPLPAQGNSAVPLSLHDALPIFPELLGLTVRPSRTRLRNRVRLNF